MVKVLLQRELFCIAQLFLRFLEAVHQLAHISPGIKSGREPIDDNLVFGMLFLSRLPSNLQMFTFKFHLEVREGVLDVDVSRDPHDGGDPIRTIISPILIKELAAVLTNLGGRELGFISRARVKGPGILNK